MEIPTTWLSRTCGVCGEDRACADDPRAPKGPWICMGDFFARERLELQEKAAYLARENMYGEIGDESYKVAAARLDLEWDELARAEEGLMRPDQFVKAA